MFQLARIYLCRYF